MWNRIRHAACAAAIVSFASACGGAPSQEAAGESAAPVVVDAPTVAAASADAPLVVDLRDPVASYALDESKGPIDFARVTVHFADGTEAPMSSVLATLEKQENASIRPVLIRGTPPSGVQTSATSSCTWVAYYVCTAQSCTIVYVCVPNGGGHQYQ